MHSYISLRRDRHQQRLVIYLNPEVNTVRPPTKIAKVQSKPALPSIEATALSYQIDSMVDYPFFQRLRREPVNLTHLWLLFVNAQEGVVSHFTRRLALIVAHSYNDYICCILAKQLNEELGNGDVSQIHRKIFERLILSLELYKPQQIAQEMLRPGLELSERLESLYSDPNSFILPSHQKNRQSRSTIHHSPSTIHPFPRCLILGWEGSRCRCSHSHGNSWQAKRRGSR